MNDTAYRPIRWNPILVVLILGGILIALSNGVLFPLIVFIGGKL